MFIQEMLGGLQVASFINIYLAQILGKHMPLITLIFSLFYLGYA